MEELGPTHTFFSFVNNGSFVGCILINLGDPMIALTRINMLGINPGGEIFYTSFTMTGEMDLMRAPLDKLLSKEDAESYGIKLRKNDREC
jgi:hypothetical protein